MKTIQIIPIDRSADEPQQWFDLNSEAVVDGRELLMGGARRANGTEERSGAARFWLRDMAKRMGASTAGDIKCHF